MKLLFVTDLHNRSERDNPKGRTDNYARALLAKQEEIIDIVSRYGIDVVLMGGDLFDRFDVPTAVINDVSAIWRRIPVPCIGVVGSHDYNGFQMKTLRRTGLGNLYVNEVIHIVGNGTDGFPAMLEVGDVRITGTSHSAHLALDPANFVTGEHDGAKIVVQMIHGDIFPKTVPWPHQTIDVVHPHISADLVLSGHIHSGWHAPIHRDNDYAFTGRTSYVNPGSLGRTENGPVRPIRGFIAEIDPAVGIVDEQYITFTSATHHPFAVEEPSKLEGSPMTDFSGLMKMISTMQLKKTDFKQHIPEIVASLYPKDSAGMHADIASRVMLSLEDTKD